MAATDSAAIRQPSGQNAGGPLGFGAQYRWWADTHTVDMAAPAPAPVPVALPCEPQNVVVDLGRTAIIVIDMQNDFCAKGGWVDHLGADYTPDRTPIAPLQRLLPVLRKAAVPVIWVNWGNRPDLANMPPNQIHLYKPRGVGVRPRRSLARQRSACAGKGFLGGGGRRRTKAGARRHQGRQISHQRLLGHAARQHPAQPRHRNRSCSPASIPINACCTR